MVVTGKIYKVQPFYIRKSKWWGSYQIDDVSTDIATEKVNTESTQIEIESYDGQILKRYGCGRDDEDKIEKNKIQHI